MESLVKFKYVDPGKRWTYKQGWDDALVGLSHVVANGLTQQQEDY